MGVNWEREEIRTTSGRAVEAIAPVIISASRATDIPALHSDWFYQKLREGYVEWTNPFSGKKQYVSFKNTRLFVFWSKNPRPFFPLLEKLDELGYNYCVHFTLNSYDTIMEPSLPPFEKRVESFIELSQRIGKDRVLWRFDPIIVTGVNGHKELLEKICSTGEKIGMYTPRLTVSFLSLYAKVLRRFKRLKISYTDPAIDQRMEIVSRIAGMAKGWGIDLFTCAQQEDYTSVGARRGKCVDEELITELFSEDRKLMEFIYGKGDGTAARKIRPGLRDRGQRKFCGCLKSKDIGMYNTCRHNCAYCYANR